MSAGAGAELPEGEGGEGGPCAEVAGLQVVNEGGDHWVLRGSKKKPGPQVTADRAGSPPKQQIEES